MPEKLSHEEIAQRFVEANVIDFSAAGKLIAELGPTLAVSDHGWHGINFGRWNTLACSMPATDVAHLVGNLGGAAVFPAAIKAGAEASRSE